MIFKGLKALAFYPSVGLHHSTKGAKKKEGMKLSNYHRSEANGPRDHGVHRACAPMMGSAPEPQHNLMSHLIHGKQARKGVGTEDDLEAPQYCTKGELYL